MPEGRPMIEVRLPQLTDEMTTAKLSAWLKREGDVVTCGEVIAEVETDKATVEIEAPGSGVLGIIYVRAGTDGVAVGTILAAISDGTALQQRAESNSEHAPRPLVDVTPAAAPPPEVGADATPPFARSSPSAEIDMPRLQKVRATALASKMAQLAGVDLSMLEPAAGRERITKADVERALGRARAATDRGAVATEPSIRPARSHNVRQSSASTFRDHELSAKRRVTAARLQEAKQTVPHFYLQTRCRVDALMNLRSQMNARNGWRLTVTDLLVFIAARALRRVPLANSAWIETAVRVYDSVDVAVAVHTAGGLITPVIRASHTKSIGAISRELRELVERARRGALKPDDYTGGTFTVSNLGTFGVSAVTPIVNPPQACILGAGAIESHPVIVGDGIAVGRTMECTLAADHRAIDGATGAELLGEIRQLMEDPLRLAFES
jgi:pyruvate dehydrogenase E2 component (dihydrolipoamide acetyltransferase)